MVPRTAIDTGEDKSLWPMVRNEKFLSCQVLCTVTFLAVPIFCLVLWQRSHYLTAYSNNRQGDNNELQ